MIKAKVSTDYKDIERIFAGGSIQKEIIKLWSTEADKYVFEAWRVLEMEGPLPLTMTTNGEPLIDYRIYGNTVQNGTPTPENPIMPIGCGERTENLFDSGWEQGYISVATGENQPSNNVVRTEGYIPVEYNKIYSMSRNLAGNNMSLRFYDAQKSYITGGPDSSDVIQLISGSTYNNPMVTNWAFCCFKIIDNRVAYIRVHDYVNSLNTQYMMVEGKYTEQTMPDYEPYGYKLPILSNSTVTSIYLGEVETTRRIKKLVLTGTEDWTTITRPAYTYATSITPYLNNSTAISSHFKQVPMLLILENKTFTLFNNKIYINYNDKTSVDDFKAYLQQQYAAGTPVTIWYVLAEPETGIVNEPLMKIGNYADTIDSAQAAVQIPTYKGNTTLDYDGGEDHFITSDGYELVDKNQNGFLLSGSTLRPSKMYIKYKGR